MKKNSIEYYLKLAKEAIESPEYVPFNNLNKSDLEDWMVREYLSDKPEVTETESSEK